MDYRLNFLLQKVFSFCEFPFNFFLDLIATSDYIKNISLKPNEEFHLEFLIKRIHIFEKKESEFLILEIFLM